MEDADGDWFSEEIATFGDRLAGARENAGLSQADLAQQLGVKLKTIRGWEQDRSEPRANRLQMMTGLLGISVGWLLTGEGQGPEGPGEGAQDAYGVLDEVQAIRGQMADLAARLELLEERLKGNLAS